MKVLVMGGTEFVSAATAKHFISCDHEVDIFTRGTKPVTYEGVNEHLIGDRHDLESLKTGLKNKAYDCVVDVSAYTKSDVENLLSALDSSQLKKYILCSTGGVYEPSEEVLNESSKRGINHNWGDYSLNKKEAEDYLFELFETDQLPVTIFRPTYIYGEGNNLYRQSYFIDRIHAGLDIPVPDGRHTQVQFVHIEDLVKTFESALALEITNGQGYNLTHSRPVKWSELVNTVMQCMDKEVQLVSIDKEMMVTLDIESTRRFFPYRDVMYRLSTDKLKDHGLHVPCIDLETGMQRTVDWYKTSNLSYKDAAMTRIEDVLKFRG